MTPLSLYVHIPFCASRCGYCDFNTYTADELGNSVSRRTFHEYLIEEIQQAREFLGDRRVSTVFFGGGTPTMIGATALAAVLESIRETFGMTDDAEVTTEANPDSVDPLMLAELRERGFTRMSFGMQSSAPGVLATLERSHTPGAGPAAVRAAIDAGFEHVNIDLIYGTPGETDDDVRRSVDDAISSGVDHISAYSLIVEDGTPLARRVAAGAIAAPDDDTAAHRYELIDELLTGAGMQWYEISNWARPGAQCRHNIAYWSDADWWGIGPGAHSHVDAMRWWNHKHPATYADAVLAGNSPRAGEEQLTGDERRTERTMLAIRMREGIPVDSVNAGAVSALGEQGLIDVTCLAQGRVVLTLKGRLLGDTVVRALTD